MKAQMCLQVDKYHTDLKYVIDVTMFNFTVGYHTACTLWIYAVIELQCSRVTVVGLAKTF